MKAFRVFYFLYIVSKHFFRYFFLFLAVMCSKIFLAQNVSVAWKVIDAVKGTPVIAANVQVLGQSVYCFTDAKGIFRLTLSSGNYPVRISCLGYNETELNIQLTSNVDSTPVIKLEPLSLALNEITVTSQNGKGLTTTSIISRTALNHAQPISLADIMQLVPGNLIENPDMSSPQQIKIREISNDANSALGTAIIVDGNPLVNDANLQNASTSRMSSDNNEVQQNASITFPTTSGMGVDIRQFSTNNIESVEVISGIPSVEYGNLTSGAVIVNTKAGATPLALKFKTDPYIKQVYLGKGIQLKDNAGAINVSMDYLNSYADVLSKYEGYDRMNGQLGYYKVFFTSSMPLTFNAKVNVYSSLDNERTDPDAMVPDEIKRASDQGLNISLKGNWYCNKTILTGMRYVFAGSFAQQESFQRRYRSGAQQGISTALVSGENYGIVLPSESLTEYRVDGKPYQFFGQLTAFKEHQLSNGSKNRITVGTDYRIVGNNGLGQIYDITNPPYVDLNAIRPRSYQDVSPISTIAVYIEDNMDVRIGATLLEIEAGVRFNNFQPKRLFTSDFGFYTEPRGNLRYTLIQNNDKKVHHLALRFGAGKLYKAPPLLSLYPNKAYLDLLSLQHYTTNVDTRTFVYTTSVFNTENTNLKPMENDKFEVGLDFKIGKMKGAVTAFHEESKNGVGFSSQYNFLKYKKYDNSSVPEGEIPDIEKLPHTEHNFIAEYRMPVNIKSALKQGVEYVLDFNKIPAISTQFIVDGAWLRTSRTFNSEPYEDQPGSTNANAYEWVGMYPAGNGKVEERFNSTLRMITHIPKLALVFTSSIQVLWYEKEYFPYYNKTPLYVFNASERIPFTEEMKTDAEFMAFVQESPPEYFVQETLPTLAMLNFRLSKEIGKSIKLSFYANNFLNHRPRHQLARGGQYIRRNQPVYFGADIQIRL